MLEKLFYELIETQEKKVLRDARRVVPHATTDDVLQPNDFPELENHPHFRYEEWVLEGIRTAYAAYLAWQKDQR